MTIQALTDMQLAFMQALWCLGEGNMSHVQEALVEAGHSFAPSTVGTVLKRMEQKGLVGHRKEGRTFIYRAAQSREEMSGPALSRVKKFFYGGSVSQIVSQLLSSESVSDEELDAVNALLEAKRSLNDRSKPSKPGENEDV